MSKSREVLVGFQSRSKSRPKMEPSQGELLKRPDLELFTLKVNKLFKGTEYPADTRVQSLPTGAKSAYRIPKLPPRTTVAPSDLEQEYEATEPSRPLLRQNRWIP